MPHPLVDQLRFTRHEWRRGLEGVSEEDAAVHLGRMNCIGWTVGHLAAHEQRCWLVMAQGEILDPDLGERFAPGSVMSTPSFAEVWPKWEEVTAATEPYLDSLTNADLLLPLPHDTTGRGQTAGSIMQRVIYHYWFHLGEIQAVRQVLGHESLPGYVGDIDRYAPYREA